MTGPHDGAVDRYLVEFPYGGGTLEYKYSMVSAEDLVG